MRRALRLAIRLYPRAWRERYEQEFTALLEDTGCDAFHLLDVVKGGLAMRLSQPGFAVAGIGLMCSLAAFTASYAFPSMYVSTMVVSIGVKDGEQASQTVNRLARGALSRPALHEIIDRHQLYEARRRGSPLEDIVERMRRQDVRISRVIRTDDGVQRVPAFQVSFAAEDARTAQRVVQDLVETLFRTQKRVVPEADLEILDQASLPTQPMSPARPNFAILGLLGGLGIGLIAAKIGRRKRV